MEIRRGSIVLACGPGEAADRARAFVVVQSDLFNDVHSSVSLCPLSGAPGGDHLFRVPLAALPDTGLDRESEVQVDKVQSLRRDRMLRAIGSVPVTIMTQIDDALRRWLQL